MNRASPKLLDFAERLILIDLKDSKSPAPKARAVFATLDRLRPSLLQIVGDLGFRAALARALASATTDVVWLRAVRIKPDGSLNGVDGIDGVNGLDELEAKVDPKEIAEGRVALLAEFFGLLVELIGERLVLQLVHTAMPNVSKDDLYFGKGTST